MPTEVISDLSDAMGEKTLIWIFGYGSLMWNPGFEFDESRKAVADGYSLRMYQGSIYHRGNKDLPGRVATLVDDESSYACGIAFRVSGEDRVRAAKEYLSIREIQNGYEFVALPVRLHCKQGTRVLAITCIANRNNDLYLGPDSTEAIADQIAHASGLAGPNCEYLFRLAESLRALFPTYSDSHIFRLECSVMERRQALLALNL